MHYNPIICALDYSDINDTIKMANILQHKVGLIKLGLEFFLRNGYDGVKKISNIGIPIFLDLKLHDIPNTVAKAIKVISDLNIAMTTVHIAGGIEMIERSVTIISNSANPKMKILGVTVLTSISDSSTLNISCSLQDQVLYYAKIAKKYNIPGIVCSAKELKMIKNTFGNTLITVVPGIRRSEDALNDQKRITTPKEAITLGCDYMVIGRPITLSDNPSITAQSILNDIGLT